MSRIGPRRDATRRRGSGRFQRCALLVAGAGLLISLVPPTMTAARWTDAEHSSASFKAMTVPAPIIDTCTAESILVSGNLLTPSVTVTWHYPATGYSLDNTKFWAGPTLANIQDVSRDGVVSTTGPVAGRYTSTFQGPILGGLLGGSAEIGISTEHTSSWSSEKSTAHITFPLVVGKRSCPFVNAMGG